MPEAAATSRPVVLLLAGDVREPWRAALAAADLEVSAPGWLDAVTAARVRRPDLVVVSTDLPGGAPGTACRGLRAARDLANVPLLVVGPGADRIDEGRHRDGSLLQSASPRSPSSPAGPGSGHA